MDRFTLDYHMPYWGLANYKIVYHVMRYSSEIFSKSALKYSFSGRFKTRTEHRRLSKSRDEKLSIVKL